MVAHFHVRTLMTTDCIKYLSYSEIHHTTPEYAFHICTVNVERSTALSKTESMTLAIKIRLSSHDAGVSLVYHASTFNTMMPCFSVSILFLQRSKTLDRMLECSLLRLILHCHPVSEDAPSRINGYAAVSHATKHISTNSKVIARPHGTHFKVFAPIQKDPSLSASNFIGPISSAK